MQQTSYDERLRRKFVTEQVIAEMSCVIIVINCFKNEHGLLINTAWKWRGLHFQVTKKVLSHVNSNHLLQQHLAFYTYFWHDGHKWSKYKNYCHQIIIHSFQTCDLTSTRLISYKHISKGSFIAQTVIIYDIYLLNLSPIFFHCLF